MFSRHVSKYLSAYCHGELSEEMRRVAEHLIGCSRCRLEFEEVKLGIRFAEQLPSFSAPEALWSDLQVLVDTQPVIAKSPWRRPGFFNLRPRQIALTTVTLVTIAIVFIWLYPREGRSSWEVARIGGAPRIGSNQIGARGRLGLGQWLETDGDSRARIDVGSIGQVQIYPNTRVRLLETKPTEHRLELERGRMSAQIWAPPKLFFVDTPSAVAADYGCAYTLEVDDDGGALLRVTSGWVALQLKDREAMVPAGAACATRPGVGPGTPYFEDALEGFKNALANVDFGQSDRDLVTKQLTLVTMMARPRDTLTLWNLLPRVTGDDRLLVYERMAILVPPPDGVTRDGILALNPQMLDSWKVELEASWGYHETTPMKSMKKLWPPRLFNWWEKKK